MRLDLTACNAGRLISRGHGRHISRTIGSWELIFVVGGCLKMFVQDEDFDVPAGDCLLLPPRIRHGGREPYSLGLSFFWIHFHPKDRECEEALRRLPRTATVRNPPRLKEYFQLFLALQDEDDRDRTGLDLVVSLILHEAAKEGGGGVPEAPPPPSLVLKLERLLTLRFREGLSLPAIAESLRYNPDYLGRLYRRHFGKTIMEAVNEKRLRHAARLLRDTTLNIGEIAYDAGYNDLAYFRSRFFQAYAMTPHAYRDLKRPGHINTD